MKQIAWALLLAAGMTVRGQAEPAKTNAAKKASALKSFELTRQEPPSACAPGDFSIAVIPDTQFYTAAKHGGDPAMLSAQIEWRITNRISRNIVFVATLGDITEDGGVSIKQWERATNAFYRLEDPVRTGLADGIPYAAVVGNHDFFGGCVAAG